MLCVMCYVLCVMCYVLCVTSYELRSRDRHVLDMYIHRYVDTWFIFIVWVAGGGCVRTGGSKGTSEVKKVRVDS